MDEIWGKEPKKVNLPLQSVTRVKLEHTIKNEKGNLLN